MCFPAINCTQPSEFSDGFLTFLLRFSKIRCGLHSFLVFPMRCPCNSAMCSTLSSTVRSFFHSLYIPLYIFSCVYPFDSMHSPCVPMHFRRVLPMVWSFYLPVYATLCITRWFPRGSVALKFPAAFTFAVDSPMAMYFHVFQAFSVRPPLLASVSPFFPCAFALRFLAFPVTSTVRFPVCCAIRDPVLFFM